MKSGNAPEADSEESHPTHRGMCIEMVIDLRNPMRSQSSSAYGDNGGRAGGVRLPVRPFGFNSVRHSNLCAHYFFMPFLLFVQARDMD